MTEVTASSTGWADQLEWRPIATYDVDEPVMLRSSKRWMFGVRASSSCGDVEGWAELVDGMTFPIPDFAPTEWAVVPEQVAFDLRVN